MSKVSISIVRNNRETGKANCLITQLKFDTWSTFISGDNFNSLCLDLAAAKEIVNWFVSKFLIL